MQDRSDGDKPWRLMISAKQEGFDDAVTFPEFYFLDGNQDFYVDQNHEGDNALMEMDGFAIEAKNNQVSDFLDGVNVTLKQANPDKPFTLTIREDYEKISGKIKGLTDQVNSILEFINKQNSVDEKSDTKATYAGDSGLQLIEYRFRNLFHEGFPAGDEAKGTFRFVMLNELGLNFDKTGKIVFSQEKFQKALESDFEGVSESIAGRFGFAAQLRKVMQGYTQSGDGVLGMREQAQRSRIKNIDMQIEAKEGRYQQKEKSLTDQFARLEASLGSMQRQQQALTATLGGGGGGNLVSQLLG